MRTSPRSNALCSRAFTKLSLENCLSCNSPCARPIRHCTTLYHKRSQPQLANSTRMPESTATFANALIPRTFSGQHFVNLVQHSHTRLWRSASRRTTKSERGHLLHWTLNRSWNPLRTWTATILKYSGDMSLNLYRLSPNPKPLSLNHIWHQGAHLKRKLDWADLSHCDS